MTTLTQPNAQPGRLFLLPTLLGEQAPLDSSLPLDVQQQARQLRYFLVENAKSARAFLKLLALDVPLQALHIQEIPRACPAPALDDLLIPLLAGHDIGILSEAGCPAIADPGAALVERAHLHNIKVIPLVGPSAILLALMGAGLNGQQFAFNGYLPIAAHERKQRILELERRARQERQTQVFIETPYRNEVLFEALLAHCRPNTQLCIATDLSLPNSAIQTLNISIWKKNGPPDFHKRPSVFCLLAH